MQLGLSEQSIMLGFRPSTILSNVAPRGVGTPLACHCHSKLEKFTLQNFIKLTAATSLPLQLEIV